VRNLNEDHQVVINFIGALALGVFDSEHMLHSMDELGSWAVVFLPKYWEYA
jgi:hypothetical protein